MCPSAFQAMTVWETQKQAQREIRRLIIMGGTKDGVYRRFCCRSRPAYRRHVSWQRWRSLQAKSSPTTAAKEIGAALIGFMAQMVGIHPPPGKHITLPPASAFVVLRGMSRCLSNPRWQLSCLPPAAEDMEENQLVGKRLLLVEDDRAVREMLKTALSENAYTVVEANNGAEAFGLDRKSTRLNSSHLGIS